MTTTAWAALYRHRCTALLTRVRQLYRLPYVRRQPRRQHLLTEVHQPYKHGAARGGGGWRRRRWRREGR